MSSIQPKHEELPVSSAIAKFNKRLRHKLHEVEHRLETLKAATEAEAGRADDAIRTHVDALETGAHKVHETLDQARVDMAAWVDDAWDVVTDWKAKFDTAMLVGRAERSERHAEASLVVAMAGVDQAEKAMLSAGLARREAETARPA